jgi:hypothetical protein
MSCMINGGQKVSAGWSMLPSSKRRLIASRFNKIKAIASRSQSQTSATKSAIRDNSHRSKQHPYSITSSMMDSSPDGNVRPRTRAVLRLTTNWNLANCITGRPAGCSPLRMRPV